MTVVGTVVLWTGLWQRSVLGGHALHLSWTAQPSLPASL